MLLLNQVKMVVVRKRNTGYQEKANPWKVVSLVPKLPNRVLIPPLGGAEQPEAARNLVLRTTAVRMEPTGSE